jgi:hypothetical protein
MEEMGAFEDEEARARRDEEVRIALSDPATAHTEAVAEAELNITYADSPIVMGESDPDPSPDRASPLVAGDRLPDLGPVTGAPADPEVRLHQLARGPGHTLLAIAVGDGGDRLPRLFAELEALVARSPLFDAVFALATARDEAPIGTIHPEAAAALGVRSLAVLAIRPDRHLGFIGEGATVADVERYASLVTGL